jgi:membrane-associated phospholipid phosphatase
MDGLHRSELQITKSFQQVPQLAPWMKGLSALGPGRLMTLLLAVLLFGVNPRLAARMTVLVLIGLWLRELIALALQSPRPYWRDSGLETFSAVNRHTYGLPSGHAMVGTAFWFYLAAEARRRWAWGTAAAMALAIGISRVYLGVHFVSDVVLGWILGLGYFAAYRKAEGPAIELLLRLTPGFWVACAAFAALAMVLLGLLVRTVFAGVDGPWGEFGVQSRSAGAIASLGGGLFGVGVAMGQLRGWAGAGGPWWLRILRIGLAGIGVRGVTEPLGAISLDAISALDRESIRIAGTFLVYAARAWFAWFVLPWLFIRLKLAEADPALRSGRPMSE